MSAGVSATVAIRRLDGSARASLLAHLLALSVTDRWLRFGRTVSPTSIASYVDRIDFGRDAILGIHDDGDLLVGMAHAAFDTDPAEVALSVLPAYRGRALGKLLFASAVAQAARRGVARLYMQFLSSNTPVLRIAERFGMDLRVRGRDVEAHLDFATQHRKQIGATTEINVLQTPDSIVS